MNRLVPQVFMLLVAAALLIEPGAAGPAEPAAATAATGEQLVMRGPVSSPADQLRYLRDTWPDQHAVAIVTAAVDPTCRGTRVEAGVTLRDCEIRVVPREYLAVRWVKAAPPGPAARFLMTYGHPPETTPFPIRIGSDLLALLAPTADRGIMAATVLAPATEDLVERFRAALREAGP